MRRISYILFVAATALSRRADADDARFGPNDVRTVFVIGKSDDKNQVQYGIHLDKACVPIGDEPVYAYWRQLERGPDVVEDLNLLDKTVYGIRDQKVLERSPEKSKVLMTVKATPDRGIAILTRLRDGKCVAEPIAFINKEPSTLESVFVHIAGFMSVDWVEIRGQLNGKPVVERVKH